MIDMGSIAAAVSSLKGASDIAKGLMSLHTMAEVQSKAIELNQALIDAQHQIFAANAAQTTMVDRVRKLEGEIAAMKDWDTEKQRYKMAVPYSGITAFAVKKDMSNGEPPHYLCANCFQSGKKSFLAPSGNKDGWVAIVCSACKFIAQTRFRGVGPAEYAENVTTPLDLLLVTAYPPVRAWVRQLPYRLKKRAPCGALNTRRKRWYYIL